jgi:hypothetical protein
MGRRCTLALSLALLIGPTGRADLTLRHKMEIKFASFLPQEAQAQARQQAGAALPNEMVVRIKGDKTYTNSGPLFAITDYGRNEITLVNPKTKQYAMVPLAEYPARLAASQKPPAIPPAAQAMLQSLRFDVESKKTGQTGLVEGIQAEESVVTLSMQMPAAAGAASAMRLEMRYWIAQPGEIRRVPALKELADYAERARRAMDPSEMLQKVFSQMPGFGEQLRASIQELQKANSGLVLKLHTAIYVPAMAQALQLAPQGAAGVDPSAALAEFQMDLADISTAPLPDSIFAVPTNYQAAPFEELVKAMVQAPPQLSVAPKRGQ